MMNKTYNQYHTLVEGKIYLFMGTGHVTSEMLQQFDHDVIELLDASPYPLVHIIQDARAILGIPPLNEVRKMKYPLHPRMGYNISVGALQHPVMRFVVGIAAAITGMRSKDVATLTEAFAYLAEKDPSLPSMETWTFPPEVNFSAS
jgi:hypothetical protein